MQAASMFAIDSWDESVWEDGDGCSMAKVRVTRTSSGDLEGTSVAELLTTGTPDGPAAYTAQERFRGTVGALGNVHLPARRRLARRPHRGDRYGVRHRRAIRNPISGTGALEIDADGVHHFTLDYELPS